MRRALPLIGLICAAMPVVLFCCDLRHTVGPPRVAEPATIEGNGELRVGAAAAEIHIPYPVVPAGYGPRDRHEVTSAAQRQMARAISIAVGGAELTLVSVDLLEIDSRLLDDLRPRQPRDSGRVWVCATHTHSGMGDYDPNPLARIAGTGSYKPATRAALLDAVASAMVGAQASRKPASIAVARADALETRDRSDGSDPPDHRLTELAFEADGGPDLRLINFAAHATTVARPARQLDADFPARLGGALFLQGAEGNASAPGGNVRAALAVLGVPAPVPTHQLQLVDVSLDLGPAEIHAGPRWTRRAAANLVDRLAAPRTETLAIARLGPLTFIAVPGEPTAAAGRALKEAVGDPNALVFGLCNGYVGYIETPDRVQKGIGESSRQYFDSGLLDRFTSAARLARQSLEVSSPTQAASGPSR